MSVLTRAWITAGAASLIGLAASSGWAQELPVVQGRKIVASVNGAPITLDELNRQRPPGTAPDPAADQQLLRRLINVRLIAQEGHRMDLDKLPEVRKALDAYAPVTLREELVERTVKGLTADPREVEETYRAAVRE